MPCNAAGCTRTHYGNGWCKLHYDRIRKHGTPVAPMYRRFWAKTTRGHRNECWLWRGALSNGYAAFRLDGRTQRAHRVIYEWEVGPIPPGWEVDHVRARGCTHRHCVNPSHLEAVTGTENRRRTRGMPHSYPVAS